MVGVALSACFALLYWTTHVAAPEVKTTILQVAYPSLLQITGYELKPENLGFEGAVLANEDNATTGSFLGLEFFVDFVATPPEEAKARLQEILADGTNLIVLMANDQDTPKLAGLGGGNVRTLNTLARRSSLRQKQFQIPSLTQGTEEHGIVIAADASDVFAAYLLFHMWNPSAGMGPAGLRPVSFHATNEAWRVRQLNRRLDKLLGLCMQEPYFAAWFAIRFVGEAIVCTNSNDPNTLMDYILHEDFELAAFHGQKVAFRNWNGQFRQPVILTDNRTTISAIAAGRIAAPELTARYAGIGRPRNELRGL